MLPQSLNDFKHGLWQMKNRRKKKQNESWQFNYLILIGETTKEIEACVREMSTKRRVPISIMIMNGHLGQLEIAVNRFVRHKILNKLFNATN